MSDSASAEMEGYFHQLKDLWERNTTASCSIFENVDVIDAWGLPLKAGQPVISPGDGFGWGPDQLDHIRRQVDFANLDKIEVVHHSRDEPHVLLAFPGIHTYGHWLLDVSTRIEVALNLFAKRDLIFIVGGPLPVWTRRFLAVYGIDDEALVQVHTGGRYRVKTLIVPNFGRKSDYLPPEPRRTVFDRMRSLGMSEIARVANRGPRILVKHTPMTSHGQRANLSNFDALEKRLAMLGFQTIVPAEMNWDEQRSVFAAAKIIVGEDSSALHNVIFSTNAALFAIGSTQRKNLLHLSLSKILGHSCEYIFADPDENSRFCCDIEAVEQKILNSAKENAGF